MPNSKGGTACSLQSLRPPLDPHGVSGPSPDAPSGLLELRGVTKRYKGFTLEDATFTLPAGHLMGLLGPNGAGKTTLLKSILSLNRINGGSVRLHGQELSLDTPELRRRIAYIPDEPKFVGGASLHSLMAAYAPFYPDFKDRVWKDLMADFGLDPKKKAKALSLGQRTRFALTLVLARDPDLFVLDEPTTGLDPVFRRELLQRFAERLDERRAILFSTHITTDLERRADLVTFLRNGKVVLSESQDAVKEQWGLVKGGLDLLDEAARRSFAGLRETPHGFEALTNDLPAARDRFQQAALVERASLEDILVLLGRRPHVA